MSSTTSPPSRPSYSSPSTSITRPLSPPSHSHSAAAAARNSIIAQSSKGWSPLQINKRDSPLKPSPSQAVAGGDGSPRRSSNSFKHVTRNSLVSNSPFKNVSTTQGRQTLGMADRGSPTKKEVIHERRGALGELGKSPEKAAGVASTPRAAIGLGISAKPRSSSRSGSNNNLAGTSSPGGSALKGTRKVSSEKGKVAFPSSVDRRTSGSGANTPERKVSGPTSTSVSTSTSASTSTTAADVERENDSPDVRATKRTPKQSMGYGTLSKKEFVSRSPFLASAKRVPSGERKVSGGSTGHPIKASPMPSPKTVVPVEKDDVFSSPSSAPTARKVSGGRTSTSPRNRETNKHSSSPTPSPPRTSVAYIPPTTLGSSTGSTGGQGTGAGLVNPFLVSSTNVPSPLSKPPMSMSIARSQHDSTSASSGSLPTPLRPKSHIMAKSKDITPLSTPIKSSLTPSRRLHGPRDESDTPMSARTAKTVTFQSVPDVKEFERMSAEGSADGSFDRDRGMDFDEQEQEGEGDGSMEWMDESDSPVLPLEPQVRGREDSLDLFIRQSMRREEEEADADPTWGLGQSMGALRVTNPDFDHASASGLHPYRHHHQRQHQRQQQQQPSPNPSEITLDMGEPTESSTADFVNTLIEEGLFSPAGTETPAFEDQAEFEMPLEPGSPGQDAEEHATQAPAKAEKKEKVAAAVPMLGTPDLGDTVEVRVTPILDNLDYLPEHAKEQQQWEQVPKEEPRSEKRMDTAVRKQNLLPEVKKVSPLELGGMARPTSPYDGYNDPWAASPSGPSAAMASVSAPGSAPAPAPAPAPAAPAKPAALHTPTSPTKLSHGEIMAKRMQASRGLGLGIPGSQPSLQTSIPIPLPPSPAKSSRPTSMPTPGPSQVTAAPAPPTAAVKVQATQAQVSQLQPQSQTMQWQAQIQQSQVVLPMKKEIGHVSAGAMSPKTTAQAPKPMDLGLPEPKAASAVNDGGRKSPVEQKETSKEEKRSSMFSLPFIGLTSPFSFGGSILPNQPGHSDQRIPSTDGSVADSTTEGDDDREMPFTPPQPAYMSDRPGQSGQSGMNGSAGVKKDDSPHRLPSLELGQGEFSVPLPVNSSGRPSPVEPVGISTPSKASVAAMRPATRPLNDNDQPRTEGLAASSDFGVTRPTAASSVASPTRAGDSTTTRVRQRISREMIRSTIEQRIADGSLSRRGSVPLRPESDSGHGTAGGVPSALARQAREAREAREGKHQSMPLSLLPTASPANRAHTQTETDRQTPSRIPLPTRVTSISKAKDNQTTPTKAQDVPPPLPPKGGAANGTGAPMVKSHTDRPKEQERPGLRPRSQTQSASQVLRGAEKDGKIEEPRSALDKLMASFGPTEERGKSRAVSGTSHGGAGARGMGRSVSAASVLSQASQANGQGVAPLKGILQRPSNGDLRSVSHSQAQARAQAQADADHAEGMNKERKASRRQSRRSLSTGDVGGEAREHRESRQKEREGGGVSKDGKREKRDRKARLTLGLEEKEGQGWVKEMQEEAERIGRGYKVRHKTAPSASYGDILASPVKGQGQTARPLSVGAPLTAPLAEGVKPWKPVRKASDAGEHAEEIRALRTRAEMAREKGEKPEMGTVFVKVLGIEHLAIPVPGQPTFACITLDNGIDYIKTPYVKMGEMIKINQEFSLVEQPNFEFSLSLDVRRDPHVLKMIHDSTNPSALNRSTGSQPSAPSRSAETRGQAQAPGNQDSPVKGGFRNLFSSPRKAKMSKAPGSDSRSSTPIPQPVFTESNTAPAAPAPPADTLARYLTTPAASTLCKTHVAFRGIAPQCEAKVLEIRYPMFSMHKDEKGSRRQLGKVTLQVLRLPPIPGLPVGSVPGCIDEVLRGLRHRGWWEQEWHEGVLTQDGGDLTIPRRRHFKLVGGMLIAYNEVTRKEVLGINLRHAVELVDLDSVAQADRPADPAGSPASRMTRLTTATSLHTRVAREEDEGLAIRPNSFAVEFSDGSRITLSADSPATKGEWMEVLGGLVGKVPTNPVWAEMLGMMRGAQGVTAPGSASGAGAAGQEAGGAGKGKERPVSMPMGAR